jgi:hypothetical protein
MGSGNLTLAALRRPAHISDPGNGSDGVTPSEGGADCHHPLDRPLSVILAASSAARLRGDGPTVLGMKTRAASFALGAVLALAAMGCEPADGDPAEPSPVEGAPTPVSPPPDIGPNGTFVPPETSPELPEPS